MQKIKRLFGRFPLWIQCGTLFSIVITIVIFILITNNYLYNKRSVINSHISHTESVLRLEMDTISSYIKELTYFAIQPCYDSKFTRVIETKKEITEEDIEYIKDQMKGYYYTRSDLSSYSIFFLNHDLEVGRRRGDQHIISSDLSMVTNLDKTSFSECASSPYFLSIAPAQDSNDFMTFYHSIIQIDNKASLAIVRCDIDKDFLNSLIKSYSYQEGEILLLYNADNELIYSDNPSSVNNEIKIFSDAPQSGSFITEINNTKYFLSCEYDESYGMALVSLQPYRLIINNIHRLLAATALQGFILWVISVLLIYFLCHLILNPLNVLAHQLKKVGEGDFDTKIELSGSSEITNLGNSFNYMSEHIQKLIQENYVVKLNEQSARLIALEAQINPHFLYNTLQAISTEALVNDQDQIHEMVISLASILRYSIKGGDYVTLADEMEHVKKYIYLQKIRMEDNLEYEVYIQDEANTCIIPKISIQTLVENSIIHGMDGLTQISIKVNAYIENDFLHITVTDNGCGMSPDSLCELRKKLSMESISENETSGIGLANLSSRLKIMYDKEGTIDVESSENIGTNIKITIPVKRGEYAKSIDN